MELKSYKTIAIVGIVCLLIGRYALQPKAEIKTVKEIEYKDRIVEVKVEDTKRKTYIKEVTAPDGTITKETTETEDTIVKTDTQKESSLESKESTKVSNRGSSLGIVALVPLSKDAFKQNPELGLVGSTPLFGSVSLTGVASKERAGLGLSIEF